ncbi:MAG: hypothetical protein AAF611_14985 [Bacteroidota bacterium]
MKQLFKTLPFIALILVLIVIACKHDDVTRHDEQVQAQETDLIIHIESGDHLRYLHPAVFRKLVKTSKHTKMLQVAKDGTGSGAYSLALNTIQIIHRNTYRQYTTPVLNHAEQDLYLINYILIEFDDGDAYQFLIKYPRLGNNQGGGIDYANAIMESIDGETLLQKSGIDGSRPCLDGVPELVNTVQQYICETTRCTGPERHQWGEQCPCANLSYCTMPTRTCGWQTVSIWSCTGGGAGGTGQGNDGTASGGSNDPDDVIQDDPILTVPLIDLHDANIKSKLLEYSNTTIIKDKLSDLGQKIFNPNYHLEDGAMYKRLADGQFLERPPDVITDLGTEFIPEFKIGEVVSLHMHPQKAWDYSGTVPILRKVSPIFSKIDIHKFLKFRKFRTHTNEDITDNNDNDIVAMLASETGIYALVVGDDVKMDQALTALGNDPLQNPTRNWTSFEKKFNMDVLDECGDNNDCLVKKCAKFLKSRHQELDNQSLGISMYQAVIINGEIVRWKKL